MVFIPKDSQSQIETNVNRPNNYVINNGKEIFNGINLIIIRDYLMSVFRDKLKDMYPELKPIAYKLSNGNLADAKDLIQKTLLKALEKEALFKDDSNQIGWVVTIMKNIHIDEKRKLKGKTFVDIQNETLIATTNSKPLEVENTLAAIKQLGENCQSVLMLIAEEYKYLEIAHQLELPLGTIMSRLLRCRLQLFKALN